MVNGGIATMEVGWLDVVGDEEAGVAEEGVQGGAV